MTAEFLPSPPEDPVYYKKYEKQEVTERTFPYWKPVIPVKKLLQWQLSEKETEHLFPIIWTCLRFKYSFLKKISYDHTMIKGTNTHPEDCYLWRSHPARSSRKPPRGRGWRRCGTAPWTQHLWWGFWSACGNTSAVDRQGETGCQRSIHQLSLAVSLIFNSFLKSYQDVSLQKQAGLNGDADTGVAVSLNIAVGKTTVLLKFKTWIQFSVIFALDSHTNHTETGIKVSILYSWRIDWLHCLVDLQERTAACKGERHKRK